MSLSSRPVKSGLKTGNPPPVQAWFVYMLRCSNGSLYTGITTDVQKRLAVHNSGKGSAYVRSYRPARLVAFVAAENRAAASSLEYHVKSLSRAGKLALAKKWKAALRVSKKKRCVEGK